jgi:protein TonB
MFEQSTVPRGSNLKRFCTTSLGMIGQAVLVGFAVLAPMLWPQILPRATFVMTIAPPGPPPPVTPAGQTVRSRATRTTTTHSLMITEPPRIPTTIPVVNDPPPEPHGGPGVPGIVDAMGSGQNGVPGGLISEILRQAEVPPVTHAAAERPRPVVAQEPTTPVRIHVSEVQMARLLRRVEPVYPPIAKSARISGTVQLEGVIGVDGRLRELRVLSGHPFLSRAALDAVSQWVYAPTILNGRAVEVVAPITVTFILK